MKYNQRELEAIEALQKIATALTNKEGVVLTRSEKNALADVLGFDLAKATLPKGRVKTWVRGKDDVLVSFQAGCWPWVDTYCYFPFQVRERTGDQ